MTDSTATPTIAEILAQAENPDYVRISTARVLLRQDLGARHAALNAELQESITRDRLMNEPDRAPTIAAEIVALEAEMEASEVEFVFRSVGRKRWADMLAKHPPTRAQSQADKRTVFNPETFPIAAIAASCSTPEGMDEAYAARLEASLSDAQFSALWNACVDANLGGGDIPKSPMAAGLTRRQNALSATIAVPEESDEANS
jgi:hypothetical protein